MELSELQTDGDNKRKGRQLRWTYGMDECMIETFLEQARLGHKGNKGFEDQAYKAVIKALAERLDTEVCKYHINHRLKSFRTEYRMFTILREQNGFVWDSTKNKVIAQDSTWNDYIKAYPKFKSYRGRACKWNFDSLGIILGKDHVSECSSTDCPDSSDSQPDLDSNEKGRQVRWSQEMDKCMIATFVGQARLGLKGEKGFKDKAYAAVCKSLVDELGVDVCKTHIDNRLRTFRTEYHMFHTLREHSDFCWDPAKNKITAPDSIWNDYLKEHPEFKSYRGRQCKWDYESLGIIVGNNQPAVSYGSSCLNASESYPEEDDKGKGKQLRWTREMDQCMIETIIKHARLSNKGNKGFKDHAYEAVRKALSDQLYVDVCRKHIDNRLKSFRTEYHMFRTLREQSGFEWDSSENTVTASDNTWNDFIKAHPKFKHYRGSACKWDYDSLGIIVGNDSIGQSVAMCGPNAAVVDMASGPTEDVEFSNELPLIDANVSHYDTDDEEERMSQDIKRTLSPCTPYLAQKRARTADVVREVMDVVNEKIGSIAKVADGLSFAKELYTEVMKVEGFSPDFLDRAFEILKRDGHGAEIFLVRTEPYRKRMLKELYDKYGDNGTSGLGGHGENGSAV
ncbi:hypothetical protein AQUCO_00900465v1 [Aquilegia coerulea]|uniref:Myb/SANT-like domain-containing protein n=1 Tax=Aquilegia coerulea TaxID=218851 RepID=A0A2G5EDS2_AQUCA|nr:hypothetical protein AQUCO_00900465v1 [Aquilegia coerulea]